ncbi:MAG: rod shape-determining protein RodA [bacterium]
MIDRRLLKNFDWVLLFITLLLCTIGLVQIYSATFDPTGAIKNLALKQLYWILIGLTMAFCVISIDYHRLAQWGPLFYFIDIATLVYILMRGRAHTTVSRWIYIWGINVQPSEFMKVILILLLAQLLKSKKLGEIGLKEGIICSFLTLAPLFLIMKQPDLGTSILLIPILLTTMFIGGISVKWLLRLVGLGVCVCPILWFRLKTYQKRRILGFINPNLDPLGAGYQVIQSNIAVGSGGAWGKGFMSGTQCQLKFLPVHHTDFIFSVLAEEWGFMGAIFALILFIFLIFRGIDIAAKAKDKLGTIISLTIVVSISLHIIINIFMVIGLLPIVGIPLPFLSYGGSAMISNFISIALLLNIQMRRFD